MDSMNYETSVQYVAIIHRQMGCNDEASSDEEQAEKILYFYPEETTVSEQLNRINMLEGLIDFSCKFARSPLDVVIMQSRMWGFYECEKDVWIIVGVDNTANYDKFDAQFNLHHHRTNPQGLKCGIINMYTMYRTLYGKMENSLFGEGKEKAGWAAIGAIQAERKAIRKLLRSLVQKTQDMHTLEEQRDDMLRESFEERRDKQEEYLGIRNDGQTTLEQITIDKKELEQKLEYGHARLRSLLQNDSYTPPQVKASMARFVRWFLFTGQLGSPSAFNGMDGIKFLPLTQTLNSSACNASLLRLRQSIEQVCGSLCLGAIVLQEREVVWSDLEHNITCELVKFVRHQDAVSLRTRTEFLLNTAPDTNEKDIQDFIRSRLLDYTEDTKGFVAHSWKTVDLTEVCLATDSCFVTEPSLPSSSSKQQEQQQQQQQQHFAVTPLVPITCSDVLYDHCNNPTKLFVPAIYSAPTITASSTSTSTSSSSSAARGSAQCVGRVLVYRQQRTMLLLLLRPWETGATGPTYKEHVVRQFLQNCCTAQKKATFHVNAHTAHIVANSRAAAAAATTTTDTEITTLAAVENVGRSTPPDALPDVSSLSLVATPPLPPPTSQAQDDETDATEGAGRIPSSGGGDSSSSSQSSSRNKAKLILDPSGADAFTGHACLLALCLDIQLNVWTEIRKLEKLLKRTYNTQSLSAEAPPALASGNSTLNSGEGGGSASGSRPMSPNSSSSSLRGVSARNPQDSAIGGPNHAGSSASADISHLLSLAKAFLYDPVTGSFTVNGIYNSETHPALIMPEGFRELLASNLRVTNPRKMKIVGAVADRLGRDAGYVGSDKWELSPSLLASSLEPAVLRAVNDIWTRLAYSSSTGCSSGTNQSHVSEGEHSRTRWGAHGNIFSELAGGFPTATSLMSPESARAQIARAKDMIQTHTSSGQSHTVTESVLRVSTAQRGGLWVAGRKISLSGKYLFVIVEKCATLNDLWGVLEECEERVNSRLIP